MFVGALGLAMFGTPAIGFARTERYGEPWTKIPSIMVMADEDDPRMPPIQAAIEFWNGVFLNLGTPFHLGSVTHTRVTLPNVLVWQAYKLRSDVLLSRLEGLGRDVIIAFSEAAATSFAVRSSWGDKALIFYCATICGTASALRP
jgi:hypothetical protein